MTNPVRVVIPTMESRRDFLLAKCLPSVYQNHPAEVVIIDGPENGNEKRNMGASGNQQPFLLFVDDDTELGPDCLALMLTALAQNPEAAFAYSNFKIVVHEGVEFDAPPGDIFAGRFSATRLMQENYINTTSLLRREWFLGFDPEIRRFQDWDHWLRVVNAGGYGVFVNQSLFTLHQIDKSVTMSVPRNEATSAIRRKHGL